MAKVTEKIMAIQEGDKVYQKMKKVTRVAITEFSYGEEFNDFTKGVQDILYTNLILQRGMTVVEREKLQQVLEEQKISFTGMIDLATAARIGKMLGVEAVVVGAVADMGNSLDIRARLVDVEKGVAITAAQIGVVKNPTVIGLLGAGARRAVYGMAGFIADKRAKRTRGEIAINEVRILDEIWKVTLTSCQLLEDRVLQFNFLIENLQDKRARFRVYRRDRSTYLLDSLGNKYSNPDTSVSTGEMWLIPKIRVKFSVAFPELKERVEIVALYLGCGFEDTRHSEDTIRPRLRRYPSKHELSFGPIKLE